MQREPPGAGPRTGEDEDCSVDGDWGDGDGDGGGDDAGGGDDDGGGDDGDCDD